ncbi:MAG: flagellar hook-length control protein FliK [Treponema sp.]|nr:flagellar hook-length control protein FliK [Treponema sp.]
MNILSISQIQTQNDQSDLSLSLSSQKKDVGSEKISFADFLRDAQRADEKAPEESAEKVAEKNESLDSGKASEENEIARAQEHEDKEKTVVQKEKSENKSHKSNEKDENQKILAENENSEDKYIALSMNRIANLKNVSETQSFENQTELNLDKIQDDISDIDDKTYSWLLSSAKNESLGDEISDSDFAAMIDAAVEFIPGEESEGEKLELAQNLAASDPEFFLNGLAENEANFETNVADFSQNLQQNIQELPLADRKVSLNQKEKKDSVKLSVHDLRSRHLDDTKDIEKLSSAKIVQKSAEKKEINLSMQKQADGNMQMTMELAAKAQENITSSNAQAATASGSDFQQMLSNAVQENAPDFVKAGNIVLKDNNQGSINLILRPEGLGNVKISLNLDDKNLSAQITVHTKEAMDAFRESIPSLKQAFTESGFETGSFDLNFSDNSNNSGFAQGEKEGQNQHEAGRLATRSYGDFVTSDSSEIIAESVSGNDYGINIVA